MKPRVKICCVKSMVEADTAIRYIAAAVGLDFFSGVRTGGLLDEKKLTNFMAIIS